MRAFIHIKTAAKGSKASSHARYMSERERDPEREEPISRPIFTHDRNGLKYKAADRYLADGKSAKAKSNDLHHIIIAFNSADAKELKKLEGRKSGETPSTQKVGTDHDTQEVGIDHDTQEVVITADAPKVSGDISGRPTKSLAQTERDLPYAEAVRRMMDNIEDRTHLSELRYAMAVHRHTSNTHIHVLLRREYTDQETGEKSKLEHRLPIEFLNGRDERNKAKSGILDLALSDALDTMIPRRQRTPRQESEARLAPAEHERILDTQKMGIEETLPYASQNHTHFSGIEPKTPPEQKGSIKYILRQLFDAGKSTHPTVPPAHPDSLAVHDRPALPTPEAKQTDYPAAMDFPPSMFADPEARQKDYPSAMDFPPSFFADENNRRFNTGHTQKVGDDFHFHTQKVGAPETAGQPKPIADHASENNFTDTRQLAKSPITTASQSNPTDNPVKPLPVAETHQIQENERSSSSRSR